jgi:hypothetical protein
VVARMSEARCGVMADTEPGYRFAHPGYAIRPLSSWDIHHG